MKNRDFLFAMVLYRSVSESRGGIGGSAPTGVPAPSVEDAELQQTTAELQIWWPRDDVTEKLKI